jgi:signal transduction histidine kinase
MSDQIPPSSPVYEAAVENIKRFRVLIVDDEATARDTLEAFLYKEGHELYFAGNGQEALAQLETVCPDTILLDVMMPEMDGFTLCRRLKAHEQWRHIPVILISALDDKESLVRGLDAGADEFLTKPVNSLELRARLRNMLRLKRQYDQLKDTMQMREELANMIAHDMRSPLSTIMGYTQLMLSRNLETEERYNFIEMIHAQADRLNAFINDMLLLAKLEQGQLIINRVPVDINKFTTSIYESHIPVAHLRQINLVLELPDVSQEISIDPNLFHRLLDNLLSNAMKFSRPSNTVTLQVEYPESGPALRFKVKDEGLGIPSEYRKRIFNKFETVSSQDNNVSQIGLGLTFCKMTAETHGGNIYVEDNTPVGSIFIVDIF